MEPRAAALRTCVSAPRRVFCAASTDGGEQASESRLGDRAYVNFTGFPFPLGPLLQRRTIRYELEAGSLWTFEQEQSLGFSFVTTNTRMTVIKLASGGLWVHAPVAPTRECIRLLKELNAPVEHIVLPTFAYEHKIFMGPFSRRFPGAQTWVAPGQWSWPVNLPIGFFGVFKPKVLGRDEAPWAEEIDLKVLEPKSLAAGLGNFVGFPEVAFFHRRSKSLLVTDCVIYVPKDPPAVIRAENLLDAAADNLIIRLSMKLVSGVDIGGYNLVKKAEDTTESRRKGWQRMALQVLFFGPENVYQPSESFGAVSGRLVVSPIVRKLVFNKVPLAVREWVDAISNDWRFRQIIPCHFAAPIRAGPADFKRAFDWLEDESGSYLPPGGTTAQLAKRRSGAPSWLPSLFPQIAGGGRNEYFRFPESDLKLLNALNDILVKSRVFTPPTSNL